MIHLFTVGSKDRRRDAYVGPESEYGKSSAQIS